jgi:hypothetical protein
VGILALQGVITAAAFAGLDRTHHIDIRQGNERPSLSWMAWLPTALPATGDTLWATRSDVRGITRWGPRRVTRVLLQTLSQRLVGVAPAGAMLLARRAAACGAGSLTLRSGIEVHSPPACWARYWGKSRTNSAKRTL